MGFLDALFGRDRPVRPKTDAFFALSTAQVTLETELRWKSAGRAGVCYKPVESGDFAGAEGELEELLRFSARESGTQVDFRTDEYGYRWAILADPDFDDLVTMVHMTAETLREKGYGSQLLSAAWRFLTEEGRGAYLVYNYKRGNFYPFVPAEGTKKRNNALELRAGAVLQRELPWEEDPTRWYALWDCPV
ncbi:MAG: hypothetical protein IRZ26_02475 [Clostridia bacterium]|nr:hypothetical protein [Clostridia bacterium]MCL6521042.1 hypothetical protein [Bacillota bacterium]